MSLFATSLANFAQNQTRSLGSNGLGSLFGWGGGPTTSKPIGPHASLKIAAFYCGVKNISDSISILPKLIYVKTDGKRTALKDHPVSKLINKEPNQCMVASRFWGSKSAGTLVKGNSYSLIERNKFGVPIELVPLHPEEVTPLAHNGRLWYRVQNRDKFINSDDILHIPGFGFDGRMGMGVVRYAADNLSVNLNADAFASESYKDKAITYGVIETEVGLKPAAKKGLKKLFEYNINTGGRNRVTVLDEGMKYRPISLTPQEAAFIEAKASGVADIARWLNIPLHKLHVSGEGGYNFLVQMSIEYLQAAVMPIAETIKEEIERKLLTQKEKEQGLYCHFNYRKLLEADPKARAQYYKDLWFIRALNSNEIRELEDLNPYEGGDDFLQPANMLNELQLQKDLNNG